MVHGITIQTLKVTEHNWFSYRISVPVPLQVWVTLWVKKPSPVHTVPVYSKRHKQSNTRTHTRFHYSKKHFFIFLFFYSVYVCVCPVVCWCVVCCVCKTFVVVPVWCKESLSSRLLKIPVSLL